MPSSQKASNGIQPTLSKIVSIIFANGLNRYFTGQNELWKACEISHSIPPIADIIPFNIVTTPINIFDITQTKRYKNDSLIERLLYGNGLLSPKWLTILIPVCFLFVGLGSFCICGI